MVKKLPANAGDIRDVGSIPGLGRSPGGGHGNPLQSSCLENPVYRGAWGYRPRGRKESGTTEVTGMPARRIVPLRKKSDNVIFIVNPH